MRAQAEALDQLALESVVRNCLRLEFGAAEITDALSGIGDDLSNHLALHRIGACRSNAVLVATGNPLGA